MEDKEEQVYHKIPEQKTIYKTMWRDPNDPNIAYIMVDEKPKNNNQFKGYSTQFKGMCFYCGKWGHKGVECPDRKNPPQEKPSCDHFKL